jgi:CheY-like chemotaxis protein
MNCDTLTSVQPYSPGGKLSAESSGLNLRCRILVADDDSVIRRLVSLFLTDEDFAVVAVSDGEQAWDALNHDDYDLLVTDNEMPCLTGIHLIARIRKRGIQLPVIMISSTFAPENLHDHPDLEIAAVITKPFGRLEILNAVRNVLFGPAGSSMT